MKTGKIFAIVACAIIAPMSTLAVCLAPKLVTTKKKFLLVACAIIMPIPTLAVCLMVKLISMIGKRKYE